jgi:hypothetical protein
VSTVFLFGPSLLGVGGLGVALLELLFRRADVAAAPALGSVVVPAALVDSVPSLLPPVGTIVHDGVNGIVVVDPHDARALAAAMHRATDPETSRAHREAVWRMNRPLLPEATAGAVLRAVARARGPRRSAIRANRPREVPQRADHPDA